MEQDQQQKKQDFEKRYGTSTRCCSGDCSSRTTCHLSVGAPGWEIKTRHYQKKTPQT